MPRNTISDTYGDDLFVSKTEGLIYLHTADADQYEFEPEGAIEVAKALYEAAGKAVVDITEFPSAHNVSFNEAMLRLACVHKRTVQFRYEKQNGGFIESRRLNPTGIVGKDDTLGVEGTDPDRDAPRRFNLGRIQGEVSFA